MKSINEIPHYSKIIYGLAYSTEKATLMCYDLQSKQYDNYGQLGGEGTYFKGCYKTNNGRYFRYLYKDEYKTFLNNIFGKLNDNRQDMWPLSEESFLSMYYDCPHKLTSIPLQEA